MIRSVERTQRDPRRSWVLAVFLGLFCLVWGTCAVADVWDTWDYPGHKRKLKVWIRGAGGIPGFAAAVQAAMDNWNGSSGEPPEPNNGDWELEPGTAEDHDVAVGGEHIDGPGGTLGSTRVTYYKSTGEARGPADIRIDHDENWGSGPTQQDLERVIKHELGHAQRMDDTKKPGDLMNGKQAAGNHNVTPSDHDQWEADSSCGDYKSVDATPESLKKDQATICTITGVPELGEATSVVVSARRPGGLQVITSNWDSTKIESEMVPKADAYHNEGYQIEVTYADGTTTTFGNFATANDVDPPADKFPHADAGPDIVVPAGQFFSLSSTGSYHDDPDYTDSMVRVWKWEDAPDEGNMCQVENYNASIGTPGDYVFELEVEDQFCRKSTDSVIVHVTAAAPENVSLGPVQTSVPVGPTTFRSVYRDGEGWEDLSRAYLLLNDTMAQTNAVFLYYNRLANRMYLKNDANSSWGTGYAPGTPVVLENSQCSVNLAESVIVGGWDSLTVDWRVELKEPFRSKMLNGYMYVQDMGGLHDGWDRVAVYYNVKPQLISVSPDSAPLPIDVPTVLASVYRDLNSASDLSRSYLLVCENFSQANAMFLWYDKVTNRVYLKNDTNTSWGSGYPPGTPVVLENSQCKVYVENIRVVEAGNDRTIEWHFSLKPSQAGRNLFSWMYATDRGGLYDGWRRMGMHFLPVPPICLLIVPSGGFVPVGAPIVYSTVYADPNGHTDMAKTYLQLSVTSSQANAVLLMYDAKQNKVYLKNDANTSWGVGYSPGTPMILENSQCLVDLGAMPPANRIDPDQIELLWPITLKESQAGKRLCERMYVVDNENLKSGWKVKGYVTVVDE